MSRAGKSRWTLNRRNKELMRWELQQQQLPHQQQIFSENDDGSLQLNPNNDDGFERQAPTNAENVQMQDPEPSSTTNIDQNTPQTSWHIREDPFDPAGTATVNPRTYAFTYPGSTFNTRGNYFANQEKFEVCLRNYQTRGGYERG